jgi:hypothetical protein
MRRATRPAGRACSTCVFDVRLTSDACLSGDPRATETTATPEPATVALVLPGLLGVLTVSRRRRKNELD